VPDSALLSAIFRAYNDWLADFCTPYPQRLKGIAMLNVDDPQDAAGELRRAAKMGLAGAMIPLRPMQQRYDHPMYEPLWAAAQELDRPLSLHVGTYRWRPGTDPNGSAQDIVDFTNRECDARNAIAAMIYAGVFERYPKLRVGVVEFEVVWAPYFLARLDNVYTERAVGRKLARFKDGMRPSDFFRRNVFISFQEDDLGIQLRAVIGVENLLWGSDYPHAESTFPKSREIVERLLKDVPPEEQAMIAGGNAARLYHFN
jgi:predicted TIM-barrel fold metal-dependent hydrolase